MAVIDDYTLTTTEDGNLVARDAEGRTISAQDYYERLVDETYVNETGRASTFNDPGGRQYWLNSLMSGQVAPDRLDDIFNASEEGIKFDARTKDTGGITTVDTGGTTKVDTGGTTKVDTGGTTKVDTGGTTKVTTDGTTKVTTTGALTRAQADSLVTRLYGEQFGRNPTQGDLDYWAPRVVAGDLNEEGLLREYNASSEGRMFDRIGDLYPLETGRPADSGGQAYYAGQVRDGKITYDQIAKLISESKEGRNFDLDNLSKGILTTGYVDPTLTARLTKIKTGYKAKLGRDPDEKGLRFYLGQEDENYDFNQALVKSSEALARDAFKRVLGREPDAEARAYYTSELDKGRTYDQIVSELRKTDEYQTKVGIARGPGDVLYSNPATAARAATDLAGFPLVSKAVTGADGKVTNKLELNLPDQKAFSLGLGTKTTSDVFKAYDPTVYAESPYVSNIFGGPSKADTDRGGVGAQKVFNNAASATQDYSNLGIGTTGGITSLADVTKAASASTLGNTMANNLGTNLGTTAGANLDLTSNAGTIGLAQGGMIMSDPVMRRAMFRNGGPVSAKGLGITSNVTTPDENAMAMQTMFQPPGFRDGGPVQYFQQGGEAEAVADNAALQGPESVVVPPDLANSRGLFGGIADYFTGGSRGPYVAQPDDGTAANKKAALQAQANAQMRQAIDDRDDIDRQGRAKVSEDRPPPPDDTGRRVPERVPYKLEIEKLKAEREANKAQRKENQLLALMQAGFAMAAGRSPNALANLAAGGASGVATLAGLEKDRRAEDTLLRREILERELAGERTSEARAERQAAREDRALSRDQGALRSEQELNARYAIAANSEKRQLNDIIGDNTGKFSEDKKKEAAAQLLVLEQNLRQRELRERELSRALSPRSVQQGSGDFRAREVGSPRPTPQR